eukprot:scaffold21350_cov118-Isochrysis_galbana.AAC.3
MKAVRSRHLHGSRGSRRTRPRVAGVGTAPRRTAALIGHRSIGAPPAGVGGARCAVAVAVAPSLRDSDIASTIDRLGTFWRRGSRQQREAARR